MKKHVRIRHVVSTLWTSVALALIPASVVLADNGNQDHGGSESQIQRGFEISPTGVTLNLAGKNRALVGLGSYIVNTTGCNDATPIRPTCPGMTHSKGNRS